MHQTRADRQLTNLSYTLAVVRAHIDTVGQFAHPGVEDDFMHLFLKSALQACEDNHSPDGMEGIQ